MEWTLSRVPGPLLLVGLIVLILQVAIIALLVWEHRLRRRAEAQARPGQPRYASSPVPCVNESPMKQIRRSAITGSQLTMTGEAQRALAGASDGGTGPGPPASSARPQRSRHS